MDGRTYPHWVWLETRGGSAVQTTPEATSVYLRVLTTRPDKARDARRLPHYLQPTVVSPAPRIGLDKRRLCSRVHLSSIARRSSSEAGRSVAGRQIASRVGRTGIHAVGINPVGAATPDLYLADSGVAFFNAPYVLV